MRHDGGPRTGWDDLAEAWVSGRLRRREIVLDTARNQRCALAGFVEVIGNRRSIERADVLRWAERCAHLAASTRRSDFSAVRGWCAWLVYEGHLRRDPTYGVKPPKEPRRVPRYLELEDVADILEACPDARSLAICWTMYGAGLRCGGIAALEIGDLNRRAKTLLVLSKGGHRYEASIPAPAIRAIDEYLALHPATTGPIFRSYRDPSAALRPDTISGLVSDIMAESGVKRAPRDGVSAHAFRHTCASELVEATGGNLWLVAEQLGHNDLATLRIYLRHARSAEMRDAQDARVYPMTSIEGRDAIEPMPALDVA